jgi:hypothetical protein
MMILRTCCLLLLVIAISSGIPSCEAFMVPESPSLKSSTRAYHWRELNDSLAPSVVIGAASHPVRIALFHNIFNHKETDSTRKDIRQFPLVMKSVLSSLRNFLAVLAICLAAWSGPLIPPPAHADIHASPLVIMSSTGMADRFLVESTDDLSLVGKTTIFEADGTVASETTEPEILELGSGDIAADSSIPSEQAQRPSRSLVKTGTTVVAMGSGAFVAIRRKKHAQRDGNVDSALEDSTEDLPLTSSLMEDSTAFDGGQQGLPYQDRKFVEARRQPKSPKEEAALAARYGAIEDVGERAYRILLDLGMIEAHP